MHFDETIRLIYEFHRTKDKRILGKLIEMYQPFIISTVSDMTNSYISIENDEEYSIALEAFAEAVEKYEPEKGKFISFAALVIRSRVKTFWDSEKRHRHNNIDDIDDEKVSLPGFEEEVLLRDEINILAKKLSEFGLDYEILADCSPKHSDTLKRAVDISLAAAEETDLMNHLLNKKRLPVSKMAARFFVSPKVIKGSREFIMSVMITSHLELEGIISWIKKSQNGT